MSKQSRQHQIGANGLKSFLARLGLSHKEIDVYLTGLRNGSMHASQIARETELGRPNVYDVLKKLQEKGLAHQLGNAYGRKFTMATSGELRGIVERRMKEHEALEYAFDTAAPLLASMQGKFYEPYPKIEFFEGIEDIKNLVVSSLSCEEKIVKTATSIKSFVALMGKEFTEYYIEKRIERKIKSLTIRLKSGEVKDPFYQEHKQQLRQVRYAPQGMNLDTTIMLFDDKVIFITAKKENIGLLLQSRDYSNTFNSWFDFLWKRSRR